jgi:hypothetical protein
VKIHGVYVIGIGYFCTIPAAHGEPPYRVCAWTDAARLFRFTNSFRAAFQRWPRMAKGYAVDLYDYVTGPAATCLAPPSQSG